MSLLKKGNQVNQHITANDCAQLFRIVEGKNKRHQNACVDAAKGCSDYYDAKQLHLSVWCNQKQADAQNYYYRPYTRCFYKPFFLNNKNKYARGNQNHGV